MYRGCRGSFPHHGESRTGGSPVAARRLRSVLRTCAHACRHDMVRAWARCGRLAPKRRANRCSTVSFVGSVEVPPPQRAIDVTSTRSAERLGAVEGVHGATPGTYAHPYFRTPIDSFPYTCLRRSSRGHIHCCRVSRRGLLDERDGSGVASDHERSGPVHKLLLLRRL